MKFKLNFLHLIIFFLLLLNLTTFLVLSKKECPDVGNVVSASKAAEKAIDYINANLVRVGKASLVSSKDVGWVYEVVTSYQGRQIPIYVSKDGEMLFLNAFNLSEQIRRVEKVSLSCKDVPKKEKPEFEVWVFSYCPYGIQYEKGLIPVVKLLGNKAEIKVKFIGAMHGKKEEDEDKRQICIREEQPEFFWKYLECFVRKGKSKECLEKVGVDQSKLNDCLEKRANEYYRTDINEARSLRISSSPTPTLNGIRLSGELAGRSPELIKQAICCGFVEKPEECQQTLSTQTPSPGFGEFEGGGSSTGTC